MKERVNVDTQLGHMENFGDFMNLGFGKEYLKIALDFLNESNRKSRNSIIDGKKIQEYDLFSSHLPIFTKLHKNNLDKFELLKSLNIDLGEELAKFSDINDLFNRLLERGKNKDSIEKMNRALSFPNEELNRVLQAVEEYNQTISELKKVDSQFLQRKMAITLYIESYETYVRVLKETYSKIKKLDCEFKKINNGAMFQHFRENESTKILMDGIISLLRNDAGHLTFDERDKHTTEELFSYSRNLLVKSMTGVIAKNKIILGFFEESIQKLMDNWDLKKPKKNEQEKNK
jgi:hypothetical protein